MNIPRRLPLIGGSLALLLIGFAAGRFSVRPAAATSRPAGAAMLRAPDAKPAEQAMPPVAAGRAVARPGGEWTAAWERLAAAPNSPANDVAAEAALEKLAETDPARALTIALAERNRQRRTDWLHAVLRGWAAVAPEAAAAWMATLPSLDHEGAETSVLDGAGRNPAAALALVNGLVQSDPANARSHANQLLRVLGYRGDYEAGVDFAAHLPENIRSEMLGTAFQYWAEAQPERALDAALKLPDGDTRTTAIDAAVSGWSQGDPASLAEFAVNLSSSVDRAEALQTALREWVQINPKAASEWMNRFDPKPELDAGAAAVALQPGLLERQPDIAASWAESITDPKLRSGTLANVLREWAARDGAAALNYAQGTTALLPEDRAALLNELRASQ